MIAICLVTKNNEDTIEKCIESIKKLNCKIYYTDLGSKDKTKKYLQPFFEINSISDSILENKNNIIKSVKENWVFFINPWEELISGEEEIKKIEEKKEDLYKILILNKEIINKSIRIVNKKIYSDIKFENPIYEEIYSNKNINVLNIFLKQNQNIIEEEENTINQWIKKEKIKPIPYYYMLCTKLKNKKYKEFINYSEKYLFIEKNKNLPSVIMTYYYLSLVSLHVFKDIKKAILNIILCIDKKPEMAEFWCLLGDLNFYLKKYQKAIYFYENAIIFGKLREHNDEFSIEIKKYKIYPEEMIKKCQILINNF